MARFVRYSVLLFFVAFSIGLCAQENTSLTFIENKNQWALDVHFGALVKGGQMRIGPGYFTYQLIDKQEMEANHLQAHLQNRPDAAQVEALRGHLIKAKFVGANHKAKTHTFTKTDEYWNFYLGSDPTRWASHAYGFKAILYEDFYADINLKIYSVGDNLKYDYIVAPYGDPSQIVVQYEGSENLSLDNGNLIIKTSVGELIEKRPIAWQFIDGRKVNVEVSYNLNADLSRSVFQMAMIPATNWLLIRF